MFKFLQRMDWIYLSTYRQWTTREGVQYVFQVVATRTVQWKAHHSLDLDKICLRKDTK